MVFEEEHEVKALRPSMDELFDKAKREGIITRKEILLSLSGTEIDPGQADAFF